MTCIKNTVLNCERTDQIQGDMVVCYSQREDSGNILLLLVSMSIIVIVITTIDILLKTLLFSAALPYHYECVLDEKGGRKIVADTAFYD